MKKLLFLPLLLGAVFARAQYVNIPDTGFAAHLRTYYPTAMSGSMLDTTNADILSVTLFKSYSPHIRNLDGIQYFDNLTNLTCECANLDTIPALPNSLRYLNLADGPISTLPELPPNLIELGCLSCLLTELPVLPASLRGIDVRENPALFCFPECKSDTLSMLVRFGTGITCLPKIPLAVISSDGSDLLPVCSILSGCPIAYNIGGMLHEDTSVTCSLDSLNPGVGIPYLKVKKLNHGVLVQQRYSSGGGYYSFDAALGDSISILVDTPDIALAISCPTSGVRSARLTATDSVFSHLDFGLQCTGVDLGVKSISGRFRTNREYKVFINAGDLSRLFNLHCADGISGTVTTTISGSASYVRPAVYALTPTSVSGSTLTYAIADFGTVNPLHAFDIIVKTDSLAVLGSSVCINVRVSAATDVNPVNDTLTFCGTVVNSFDPNEKTAYPHARIGPDEWITYTIGFQNTGTDTAYRVLLRDTLDKNLDPASFTFLGSSHNQPEIGLDKNAILFNFSHINLPDSLHDEPNSHGWVQYKVKTLPAFPTTAIIYNKASIYFDGNEPVVTNTTRHAQFELSVKDPAQAALRMYPNPVDGILTVEVPDAGVLRIYNIVGSRIIESHLHTGSNTISLPKTLPPGLYIYRFDAQSGSVMQGKLEKR